MLLRKPKESKDNLIKFKDLVVAYVNPMQMKTVQVTEDNTFFDAGPGRYYPKVTIHHQNKFHSNF